MWVPGVHAQATVGMRATNASAPIASRQRRATGLLAGLARIVVGRVTDTVVGAGFASIVELLGLGRRPVRRTAACRPVRTQFLPAPAPAAELLRAPRDAVHRHAADIHDRLRATMHLAEQRRSWM